MAPQNFMTLAECYRRPSDWLRWLLCWPINLYRLLASRIGNRYRNVRSRHLFRHFVDAGALIEITARTAEVRFGK